MTVMLLARRETSAGGVLQYVSNPTLTWGKVRSELSWQDTRVLQSDYIANV